MPASNQSTFMTACLSEEKKMSRREPISYETDISVFMLISVIINLKWTSVCIIFDKETEKEALYFHERLSYYDIFAVTYDMEEITSSDIDDLLDAESTNSQKVLKFIMYCHSQLGEKFLSQWKPYVEIDDKTKEYKGMTIELLNELSRRLNYSYELKSPPDGKWGVVSGNNVWNGLIGQLQRREVDLVAAPLVIDVLRETVVDFTQPYFHEKSGIIIKKPVASYSKKLHVPVNSIVFLCIGLSLIVVTFCLFLFEQFNPYNKNVAVRMKIRGLHHLSDSFWYVIGAILRHGGQHVAASSAGKTLLSCWWLFCILMAATYSGNFVAILTVTKETLPFEDAEGLVAQNTYKWGTSGSTIFETILKSSELPERQKLWNGILEFNKSDPSVLSSDPAEQIRKVRGGYYAYIGERIYLDMAIGKKCDMTVISSSDFHPLLIAPALPNNSPFLNVFSDEIVTIIETGLIQMWQQKTWPKPTNCQEASVTDAKTITVLDFHFAFCLCGLGVILAILSLIFENIKQKWILRQSRRQKEQMIKTSMKDISPIEEFYRNLNAVKETPLKIAIRRQILDTPRSLENKRKNYSN
ncbi:probable glutamate receptor [Mytilus trossulus]|uniref:probable glutamate receptor n=1 Tax=Mytilus trossulus TaxID=6551 RepID=UPI003005350E